MLSSLVTKVLIPFVCAVPQGKASVADAVAQSLRESHENAVSSLRSQSRQAHGPLRDLAFDEKMPLNTRWRAFMTLTDLEPEQSLPDIEKALQHKTWFMRSAALLSLQRHHRVRAVNESLKKLEQDPSLMVRMKALEILKDSAEPRVAQALWGKLHSKDSFHNNRSLWIREDIAQILLQKADGKDWPRWVRLLHDRDPRLQTLAAQAIRGIRYKNNSGSELSVSHLKELYPYQSL